jgi:hypothetical protein
MRHPSPEQIKVGQSATAAFNTRVDAKSMPSAGRATAWFLLCRRFHQSLAACLGTRAEDCIVFGDAVWDHVGARRAGMLRVGVLTGGYGEEELYHAGPFRVYRNVADLLHNLDELGIFL